MLKSMKAVFDFLKSLADISGARVITHDYLLVNPVRFITPINHFELAITQLNVSNILCVLRMLRNRTYHEFELNTAGISNDLRRLINRSLGDIYPGAPRNIAQMKENIAAYAANYDETIDQAESQYQRSIQPSASNMHYVQNWLVLIKLSTIIYQKLDAIPINVDTSEWFNLILNELIMDWDLLQVGVPFGYPSSEAIREAILRPGEDESFPEYLRPANIMYQFAKVASDVVLSKAVPLIVSKDQFAQAYAARERLKRDNKIISGGAVTNKFFYNIQDGIADTNRPILKQLLADIIELRYELFSQYMALVEEVINYGFTLVSGISDEFGRTAYTERISALELKLSQYKLSVSTTMPDDNFVYSIWSDILFGVNGILEQYTEDTDWRKLVLLNDDQVSEIIARFEAVLIQYAQMYSNNVKNLSKVKDIEPVNLLPIPDSTLINSLEMLDNTDFKSCLELFPSEYVTDKINVSVFSAQSMYMKWVQEFGEIKNLSIRNMVLTHRSSMAFWKVARVGSLLEQEPHKIEATHLAITQRTANVLDEHNTYADPSAAITLSSSATVSSSYPLVTVTALSTLLDEWFDKLSDYADYDQIRKKDVYMETVNKQGLSVASEDVQIELKRILFEDLEIQTALELFKTDLNNPGTTRIFSIPLERLSNRVINYNIVKDTTLEKLVPVIITGDIELASELAVLSLNAISLGERSVPVRAVLMKPSRAIKFVEEMNNKPDGEFSAFIPSIAELVEFTGASEIKFDDMQPVELSVGVVKNESLYYPNTIYGPVAHRLSTIDFPVFTESVEQMAQSFTHGGVFIHDWTGKIRKDRQIIKYCLKLLQTHLEQIANGNVVIVNVPIVSEILATRVVEITLRADEMIQEIIYRILEHAASIAKSEFGMLMPCAQYVNNIQVTEKKVVIAGTEFEAARAFQAAIILILCQAFGEWNTLKALQGVVNSEAKTPFGRWSYIFETLRIDRRVQAIPEWMDNFICSSAVTFITAFIHSLDNEYLMRLMHVKRVNTINIHGPSRVHSIRSVSEYV